jgi:hypothetical protein
MLLFLLFRTTGCTMGLFCVHNTKPYAVSTESQELALLLLLLERVAGATCRLLAGVSSSSSSYFSVQQRPHSPGVGDPV